MAPLNPEHTRLGAYTAKSSGQQTSMPSCRTLLVWLVFTAIALFAGFRILTQLQNNSPRRYGMSTMEMGDDADNISLDDPFEDPLPAVRTAFGSGGTLVFGWPSTGGVWVHTNCYGVELDFLGLDRFQVSETQRVSDPDAEDAFCQRLDKIGARFYATERDYNAWSLQRDRRPTLWVGWPGRVPEDGSFALWVSPCEGAEKGTARIRNAFDMAERVEAIKSLGGRFYQRWEDVKEDEPLDDEQY